MNSLGSSILTEFYCWKDKTRKCVVMLNSSIMSMYPDRCEYGGSIISHCLVRISASFVDFG
jgi:hypothetical protein